MVITMQSKNYKPELVINRYVRRCPVGEVYMFCEVGNDSRYDLRQGRVYSIDLPVDVRNAADEKRNQAFGYVHWPITNIK